MSVFVQFECSLVPGVWSDLLFKPGYLVYHVRRLLILFKPVLPSSDTVLAGEAPSFLRGVGRVQVLTPRGGGTGRRLLGSEGQGGRSGSLLGSYLPD